MSSELATGTAAPFVPPTKPRWPGVFRVIAADAGFIASVFIPTLLVAALLPPAAREATRSWPILAQTTLQMFIYAGTLALTLLVLWALSRFVDRRKLSDSAIRIDRRSLPALGLGLLLAIGVSGGLTVLATQAGLGRDVVTSTSTEFLTRLPIIIGLAFFFQGIPEELVFRGYIMSTLWRRPRIAFAVSVVFFGLGHLISQGGQQNMLERVLYLGPATAFAFAAAALLLLTRSIWSAVGIHAGSHLGHSLAELAGGLADGPVIWGIETIGFVLIGVVALLLAKRAGLAPEFFGTAALTRRPQSPARSSG